jgi:phage baseplate assembly protein W
MSISEEEQLVAKNTVSTNLLKVIGNGIDFPLRFSASNQVGTIEESNAGERIKDSIHIILATRIAERPFNPEFGSRLPELVFEPNDEILKKLLIYYTADALKRWEKRIEVIHVHIIEDYYSDRNTIGINIQYLIRNSHIEGSYVYPFVRDGMLTSDLYTGSEVTRMNHPGSVVE